MANKQRSKRDLTNELDVLQQRVTLLEAQLAATPALDTHPAIERDTAGLTSIIESMPEGVSVFRGDKRLFVNQAFADIRGYASREAALATPVTDFLPPAEQASWERDLANGVDLPVWRLTFDGPDGTTRTVEDSFTRIIYEGAPACAAIVRDVTESERAIQDLRASEQRFRHLFEFAPMGIAVRSTEGIIVDVNPALASMLETSPAELVGKRLQEFTPPETRRNESLSARIGSGEIDQITRERQMVTKSGSIIWTQFTQTASWADDGTIDYVIATVEDITERKRYEKELAEREERYRAVVENMIEGVSIFRGEQRLWVNQTFVDIYGFRDQAGALKGSSLAQTSEWERNRLLDIDDDTPLATQYLWQRPDGEVRFLESTYARISFHGEMAWCSVIRDTTRRREAEQLRQHLYWRLSESKEEQSRFIARELHDEIGQQLTGLKLQLELGTQRATSKALKITRDLMKRVRYLSLDLRPSALDDFGLTQALTSLTQHYTELTSIQVRFEASDIPRLDPAVEVAAYRIIQESLTNVARHAGVKEVQAHVSLENGALRVWVKDGGRGIPSRRDYDAVGTGLNSMRERALAVGGTLTIDSEPSAGTTVTATLPASTP